MVTYEYITGGTWSFTEYIRGDVNIQSDWNQTDTNADDFIKNKPTIPDEVVEVPLWQDETTAPGIYSLDSIINYNGTLYKNLTGVNTDTTPDIDATNWASLGGGSGTYVFPLFAESTGALTSSTYYSFGNGSDNVGGGIVFYGNAKIIALSHASSTGGTSPTGGSQVELYINGVATGVIIARDGTTIETTKKRYDNAMFVIADSYDDAFNKASAYIKLPNPRLYIMKKFINDIVYTY